LTNPHRSTYQPDSNDAGRRSRHARTIRAGVAVNRAAARVRDADLAAARRDQEARAALSWEIVYRAPR